MTGSPSLFLVRSASRGMAAVCLVLYSASAAAEPVVPSRGEAEALSQPITAGLAEAGEGALSLDRVTESVDRHFPMLRIAELERDVREGELESSRGGLDTRLSLGGDTRPTGFYQSYGGEAGLEQQTRLWGARVFAGYRYGGGDHPSYRGDVLTDGSGEVQGGLTVPLLRGGMIDPIRAALARGEIDLEQVGPEIELRRIEVHRDAARAYWDWVATGLGLEVARELLDKAEGRQSQIEGRVRKGAEPEIDLVDNERLIVDRRLRLRGAQRDFERASVLLSLFLRDEQGRPVQVGPERLPAAFPEEDRLDRSRVREDIEHARSRHPLVQKLAFDLDRWQVDERLARNDLLPNVDLSVAASQDFGTPEPGIDTTGKLSPAPRSDTEVKALIRVELPIQRRKAKGRLAVARSRVAQIEQRMRFESERVVAEVQRAVASLDAAYDQTLEARRNRELAERMRRAEERKFELGLSNLIDVNIREIQAASAAQSLIDAQVAYFVALADYEAAAARPAHAPAVAQLGDAGARQADDQSSS